MDTSYLEIERLVDGLFPNLDSPLRPGQICVNPVTGAQFGWRVDPIAVQKAKAVRALRARWFYRNGPSDAPQLPLSHDEIEEMRFKEYDPLCHIVAHFAWSLRSRNWDYNDHPSFEGFARSVLASKHMAKFVREDKDLCKKYPPCSLCEIGPSGIWQPEETKH